MKNEIATSSRRNGNSRHSLMWHRVRAGLAKSRFVHVDTALNFPFGRAALRIGERAEMAVSAGDEAMEAAGQKVQNELDRVFDEAHAIVDTPA